jgi:hypothetical protein
MVSLGSMSWLIPKHHPSFVVPYDLNIKHEEIKKVKP